MYIKALVHCVAFWYVPISRKSIDIPI